MSVVGESHHQGALRRAARGAVAGGGVREHIEAEAILVPEPEHPHDHHAVRVDLATDYGPETVGHLPREQAPPYQAALLRRGRGGGTTTCPARITGGGPGRSYGVYLHLGAPATLIPEPGGADLVMLEPTRQVTVTREEDHQPALAGHHRAGTPPTRVVARLGSSRVTHGRHRGSYAVEVRLGANRVGELTAAMSERYRELVHGAESRGRTAACEGVVTHGERGFQVELRLPSVP